MGDKGKKDKDKGRKQKINKQEQKAKEKIAKQTKEKWVKSWILIQEKEAVSLGIKKDLTSGTNL